MINVSVQKQLGDFRLDASFDAPAGVTAIFGRSGSGKTSLLNAVAGLMRPDGGHVSIDGETLFDATAQTDVPVHQRRCGYVFQDARLFPHMTVMQNLSYGGKHDADAVIAMLGLGSLLDRRPAALSGGERQRVALGRALMSNPRILLMDEPLAALDAPRKAEILPYLEHLRDVAKVPILYVTHAMSEVARLATTLVILENGKVSRVGPLDAVLTDPASIPLIGVREAGAVLIGRIAEYDAQDQLTRVAFSGGDMLLPGRLGDPGKSLRLRIPAQDVILSDTAPQGLSALNVWPVTVQTVEPGQGPGVAVVLEAGNDRLVARVTRRSAQSMALAPGHSVYAILKATAIAGTDVGRPG